MQLEAVTTGRTRTSGDLDRPIHEALAWMARREGEVVMPITLQSTAGGFSAEFMSRLPELERAMTKGGLEPSDFVFSKDFAAPAAVPFVGPFFYDYTVFTGDQSFTVTEPNDIRFLDYIYDRCLAAEKPDEPEVARPSGMISRFLRWMAQPI